MQLQNNVYTLKNLSQYPNVVHAISTKAFGSMKKEDLSIHHANLLKFCKTSKIVNAPICMDQVHGNTVAVVENNRLLVLPKTDGLVTDKKKLPLAVITADCLPILLYDPQKEAVGVAHAGYKGLLNGIIGKTIEQFVKAFESAPKDIVVGIGPSIEAKCYEVDKDLVEQFEKTFPTCSKMYYKENGKYYLDLRNIALQSLMKEGILEEHIEVSDLCTKCTETLYSYRGGDKSGRFVSVISLV